MLLAALESASGRGFDTHAWQLAWALTKLFLRDGRWHQVLRRAVWDMLSRIDDPAARGHLHRAQRHAYAEIFNWLDRTLTHA